ncbi:MAG TPA: AraC family transcriptional regulator [Planctomycetota bacterium]|nr:AraC family transcriptional regulator [Planctomycetota bacterium]
MSPSLKRYERDFVFRTFIKTPINVLRTVHNGLEEPHDHDFVEVVLVAGGSAAHQTMRGVEQIGRGDLFVLRPGTWHAYERSKHLDIFNVCFGPELLRNELAWMIDEPALAHLFWSGPLGSRSASNGGDGFIAVKLSEATTKACIKQLDALKERLTQAPLARAAHIAALLTFLNEIGSALPRDCYRADPVHSAVVKGMRLLEEDLSRAWSLNELAKAVHLDPSYLVRLFRAATGLPPMAYLARCRAERAAAFLLKTSEPVSEIGAAVGWPEPYYFARRFKFHFGMSASEYRRLIARSGVTVGSGFPARTSGPRSEVPPETR